MPTKLAKILRRNSARNEADRPQANTDLGISGH